jgi:hypothetical protein
VSRKTDQGKAGFWARAKGAGDLARIGVFVLACLFCGVWFVVHDGPGAAAILFDEAADCSVESAFALTRPRNVRVTGVLDLAHVIDEETTRRQYGVTRVAGNSYYYPLLDENGARGLYVYSKHAPAEFVRRAGVGRVTLTGVLEDTPEGVRKQLFRQPFSGPFWSEAEHREFVALAKGVDKADPDQAVPLLDKKNEIDARHWPPVVISVRLNFDVADVRSGAVKGLLFGCIAFAVGVVIAVFAWRDYVGKELRGGS